MHIEIIRKTSPFKFTRNGKDLPAQVIYNKGKIGIKGIGRALTIDDIGKKVIRCAPISQRFTDWSYTGYFTISCLGFVGKKLSFLSPIILGANSILSSHYEDLNWLTLEEYKQFIEENLSVLNRIKCLKSKGFNQPIHLKQLLNSYSIPAQVKTSWKDEAFVGGFKQQKDERFFDQQWADHALKDARKTFFNYSYQEAEKINASEDSKKRIAALKVLFLTEDATSDEIKKSYKHLALKCHPDRKGDAKTFIAIQEAYEFLIKDTANALSLLAKDKESAYLEGKQLFFKLLEKKEQLDDHILEMLWKNFYDQLTSFESESVDEKFDLLFLDLKRACIDRVHFYQCKNQIKNSQKQLETIGSFPIEEQKIVLKGEIKVILSLIQTYDLLNQNETWKIAGTFGSFYHFKEINNLVIDRVLALKRALAEIHLTNQEYNDAITLKRQAYSFFIKQKNGFLQAIINALELERCREKKRKEPEAEEPKKKDSAKQKDDSARQESTKQKDDENFSQETEKQKLKRFTLEENIQRNLTFFKT